MPLGPAGEALLDRSATPSCPEHSGGHVVRNGIYGKTTERPRQIYRCTTADGSPRHQFTPVLARDYVHEGTDQCDACDELRGVHHGDRTAAHGHSWNARLVARGLERLALGESYAAVGRWARQVSGTDDRRARTVAQFSFDAGSRRPDVAVLVADTRAAAGTPEDLQAAVDVCNTVLATVGDSTATSVQRLRATHNRLAGLPSRARGRDTGTIDEDGNIIYAPRHHPTDPKHTPRRRRFSA